MEEFVVVEEGGVSVVGVAEDSESPPSDSDVELSPTDIDADISGKETGDVGAWVEA